jgi:hypothetical protein
MAMITTATKITMIRAGSMAAVWTKLTVVTSGADQPPPWRAALSATTMMITAKTMAKGISIPQLSEDLSADEAGSAA